MASVSIQIKNIQQIKSAFRMAPELMTKELDTAIKQSILSVEGESKKNTPVDTGRLRASHFETFKTLYGKVETNTKYAIFVHDGTRYVTGRPFLSNAVKSMDHDIQEFFVKAVQRVLDKIGRDSA